MKVVVAPVDDFKSGERRIITVGGRSIGVFRVGDRFYGIRNRCPHQGGPLCRGRVAPWARSSGPGDFQLDAEATLLACPWHGWEYDLASGQSFIGGSEPGVKSYGVELEPGRALAAALDEQQVKLIPGPYTAETFEVRVEDDYAVLEV